MKRRALIIILCIAAVCILSACNKTEGPTPEKPEAAYKDTLADMQGILSSPESAENIFDGMYMVSTRRFWHWAMMQQIPSAMLTMT